MKTLVELMARSVGARPQQNKNCDVEYLMSTEALEAFAELVRADERARMAEQPAQQEPLTSELENAFKDGWQSAKAAYGIKEQPAQQEPVSKEAIRYITATLAAFGPDEAISMTKETWAKLRGAIKTLAEQPAQQQEPVGRLESDPYEGHVFVPRIDGDWSMLGEDLYTAPPAQRKPLTPEWIWTWLMDWCWRNGSSPANYNSLFKMVADARAIEAAHGIKENT